MSRFKVLLVILILILPLMKYSVGIANSTYFWAKNDDLKSINLVESSFNINVLEDELIINTRLEIVDYGRSINKFKIKVHLPEEIKRIINEEYIEFGEEYYTRGRKDRLNIEKTYTYKYDINKDNNNLDNYFMNYFHEVIRFELYNNNQRLYLIYRRS